MNTAPMTKARDLEPGDTFLRWERAYTVIENERGVGGRGRGRSIMATAEGGERVILRMKAMESVEVIA